MNQTVKLSCDTAEADLDRVFACFQAAFAQAPHDATYILSQTAFEVRAQCHTYLRLTDRALASRGTHRGTPSRIAVGVAGVKGFPVLKWTDPYFEERRVEAVLAKTRYRMHYFLDRGFWQVFDRETGRGMQIMASDDGYPDWDPGSPLRNFVQWRLVQNGGALIHAGTLASGEDGVLLVGAGGSGKSGTVLAGVLHGLGSVGDDYVFVNTKTMAASALFDTLKQDTDGLVRLGLSDHGAIPKQTNWQNKHQFYLPDLAPDACRETIRLKALFLPAISNAAQTTMTPATAKEGFLALAPSGVSQIPGDRPVLYATAAEVARRLPCYHLHLGTDPAEISNVIRTFIDEN